MKLPGHIRAAASLASLILFQNGCARWSSTPTAASEWRVPAFADAVILDGVLNDGCYARTTPIENFVIASEPGRRPAPTRAWLLWNERQLVFAFDCDDSDIVASPPTANERDVDPQDRVELFLWSGREADAYYCIEVSASGAAHDYSARFYRRFDDTWSPRGWQSAVKLRPGGYRVEAAISREALAAAGLSLSSGEHWRVGLFRADFSHARPDTPDWITWIEPGTPKPDFHVAGAFREVVLGATRR